MLIGIDASRAVSKNKTGTERYSYELIKALGKLDKKNQYLLYSPQKPEPELKALPSNFRWRIIPFPRLWSQLRLAWELVLRNPRPNVVLEPAHTIPLVNPVPSVVTIHDLGFKYFPEIYTPFERFYHNFSANFSTQRGSRIIAVSNYTKKDILKNYHIPPEKIKVVYHGIDHKKFYPAKQKSKAKLMPIIKAHPELAGILDRDYILYVGRIEAKKNITNLVRAYSFFRSERRHSPILILAGKPGYGFKDIKSTINDLTPDIKKDVCLTGFLKEKFYPALLRRARVFALVSNFEGFGMPVLEAFASGVPVLASKAASLPEVVGKAGILVEHRQPLAIAVGISQIFNKPSLARTLIKRGLKRAKKFTWKRCAEQTLRFLEEVGGEDA